MISKQFKKSIIKRLKDDYNVACHSIRMDSKEHNRYQEYTLSCFIQHRPFKLSLILNICPVDSPNESYSFYVFAKPDCVDCIPDLNEKTLYSDVVNAITEVRDVFSYLNSAYEFIFEHNTVTLISGIYLVSPSYFEIKFIKSAIETSSVVKVYDFINSGRLCTNINITANEIFVSPWKPYAVHPTFKKSSNLLSGDSVNFKANFAKSVLLFFNENCRTSDEYDDEEADYMSLNYEDLKRYLLVKKMTII